MSFQSKVRVLFFFSSEWPIKPTHQYFHYNYFYVLEEAGGRKGDVAQRWKREHVLLCTGSFPKCLQVTEAAAGKSIQVSQVGGKNPVTLETTIISQEAVVKSQSWQSNTGAMRWLMSCQAEHLLP